MPICRAASNVCTTLTGTHIKMPNCCLVITSPVGSVAKYCDEYVCLCVCVSVREEKDISATTRAILTNFLCMLPMSVARGTFMIGRIAYRRVSE